MHFRNTKRSAYQETQKSNGAPGASYNRHVQVHNDFDEKFTENPRKYSSEMLKHSHIRHGSDESTKVKLTNNDSLRLNTRSLKRSSSYTNAVLLDLPPENSQSQLAKYDSGNYYVRLPTQNPDDSIT